MIPAILLAVSLAGPALTQPGEWHGGEVPVRDGEEVLVLVENAPLQCALEPGRVTVRRAKDPTGGVGKSVSLQNQKKNVVSILARVPGVKAGAVETVQVDSEDQSRRENPTKLHFHGVEWRIEVKGKNLIVSNGKETQTLMTDLDDEGMPAWELYWAGDIDHDGKLDLLYDVNTFNAVTSELALSSAARKGELMRVVARDVHTGC